MRVASPASASSSLISPSPRVRHAPARTLPSQTAPVEGNIRRQRVAGDQSLHRPLSLTLQQGLLKLKLDHTNSGWGDSTSGEAAFLDAESRDGAAFRGHEVAAGARMQPSKPQLMTDSVPTQMTPEAPHNLTMTRWRVDDDMKKALGFQASHPVAGPIHSAYTSPTAIDPKSAQRFPCHEVCYECAVPNSNDLQYRHFEPCTHQYCPNCAMSFAPQELAPSVPCWPVNSSHGDWAGKVQHVAERMQASIPSITATLESNFRQPYEGNPYNMGTQYAGFDYSPPTLTPSSGDRSISSYSVSTPLPQQGLYRVMTEHPQPFARDAFPPTGASLTAFAYGGQDYEQTLTSQNDLLSLQGGFPNDDLIFAHPTPKPATQNALSLLTPDPASFAFGTNDMADLSFPSDSPSPLPQHPQNQTIYQNTLRESVDDMPDGLAFSMAQSTLAASSLEPGQYYLQETAAPATDLNTEWNVIGQRSGLSGQTPGSYLHQTFTQNAEDVETADFADLR